MTSIRERILQVIQSRISTAIAPIPVIRQPTTPIPRKDSPALVLAVEGETVVRKANLAVERILRLRLVALARGDTAFTQTDQIIVKAHGALMAEPSLDGLALGLDETDLDWDAEDADAGAVALPARFDVRYRTAIHDLTQNG